MKLYISTVFQSIDAVLSENKIAWKATMIHYAGYTDQGIKKDTPSYELHVPSGLSWSVRDEEITSGNGGIMCENINQRAYDRFMAQSGLPVEVAAVKFDDVIFDPLLKSNIIPDMPPNDITAIKPVEIPQITKPDQIEQENIIPLPLK